MQVDQLGKGLWRWTAPHPAWDADPANPYGGWDQEVACLYHETPDGIVLIDPLVPEGDDGERFWFSLDRDVARVGLPPTIVVSTRWHTRSADVVRARYDGTRTLAIADDLPCHVDEVLTDAHALPGGVGVLVAEAPADARMAFVHCPCHRMLWTSDLLIGATQGGLTPPPAAWFDDPAAQAWLATGLPQLWPRLHALDSSLIVPAHGAVVATQAQAALELALRVDH